MATSVITARIDADLKADAEEILSQLGISPAEVLQMLYSQIILTGGIPFAVRPPNVYDKPKALGSMTRDELDAELRKGMEEIKSGYVYTQDEVDAEMALEFGI